MDSALCSLDSARSYSTPGSGVSWLRGHSVCATRYHNHVTSEHFKLTGALAVVCLLGAPFFRVSAFCCSTKRVRLGFSSSNLSISIRLYVILVEDAAEILCTTEDVVWGAGGGGMNLQTQKTSRRCALALRTLGMLCCKRRIVLNLCVCLYLKSAPKSIDA